MVVNVNPDKDVIASMRIFVKCIAAAGLIPVTLAQWICRVLMLVAAWFFYLLAIILFLTAILSMGFQLDPPAKSVPMITIAFFMFIIPMIVHSVAEILEMVRIKLLAIMLG